jgi:SAM-dependent methyltransferase
VIAPFSRLLLFAFVGSCLLPVLTIVCSELNGNSAVTPGFLLWLVGSCLVVLLAAIGFAVLLSRAGRRLDDNAQAQARFANQVPARYLNWAIAGAAAVSLLLELAVIRWQGAVFEFFAFYKNFTLLCCFAGLGLGYALASRDRLLLGWVIPLLAWQFLLLIGLRYGLEPGHLDILRLLPFREQLAMGSGSYQNLFQAAAVYFLLTVVFLLTVLAFLPIGQLCGCLMERREKLSAYGLNLLGSLAGVLAMLGLSALWTPPLIWFGIAFLAILLFYLREPRSLAVGVGSTVVALMVLAWPVGGFWQRIYSPYQLLEIGYSPEGLMLLRAAGQYYQQVRNLAPSNRNVDANRNLKIARDYYDLPYRIHGAAHHVAIVGAGTGNDVAAALRAGVDSVDAIEIDPVILLAGKANHPERPYADKRVRAIVNDARSFLRTTDQRYDLVVYGLLDSHALLSQASSVRLDSFVYTVEGLREARARLKPGGVLSLSFAVLNDQLGRKIYLMLQEAFDGRPPICLQANYGVRVIFLESRDAELKLPPQLLAQTEFEDRTPVYSDPKLQADVSTDDWPFFYMPERVYPLSYLGVVILLLILSLVMKMNFFPEPARLGQLPFFLLGVGFMLVETKGITELGLTFGNSWQVIGIVISGILAMAFLANCVVQWLGVRRPLIPYLLLLLTLGLGWAIARGGGFASTPLGRLEAVVILTGPIFFSGIVFSTLVASRGKMAGIMALNLLGAMLGGLLEYNSMYFGFRFLYLLAIVLYSLALMWELFPAKAAVVPAPAIVDGG